MNESGLKEVYNYITYLTDPELSTNKRFLKK